MIFGIDNSLYKVIHVHNSQKFGELTATLQNCSHLTISEQKILHEKICTVINIQCVSVSLKVPLLGVDYEQLTFGKYRLIRTLGDLNVKSLGQSHWMKY